MKRLCRRPHFLAFARPLIFQYARWPLALAILFSGRPDLAHAQLPTELITSNKVVASHIYQVLGLPLANRFDSEFTVSTTVPSPGFVHHPVERLITYIGYDRLVQDILPKYKLVDPRETTVTFADGGKFGPISNELGSVFSELYVYNHSDVIVDGGSFSGDILGLDDSTLNVVRGSVTQVDAHKESQIYLQSTGAAQSVRLFGMSKLLANGGQLGHLDVAGNTSALLYDTDLDGGSVTASGAASVEISGLSDIATLITSESSQVILTGAKVGNVSASDDSRVDIVDGNLWGLIPHVEIGDRATLQLLDSDAQDVLVIQSGKLDLLGAKVDSLRAQGSAVVNSIVSRVDSVVARGNATVSLSRGTTDHAEVYNSSTLNLTDVSVSDYISVDGGTLNVYQGEINGGFEVDGGALPSVAILSDVEKVFGEVSVFGPHGKLRVDGSTFFAYDISAYSHAEVTLAGVSVSTINSLAGSVVEISNTTVRNAGVAANGGKIFMKSGHITNDFMAIGPNSAVILEGGAVDRNLVGFGGALVTMSGGFVAGKAYIDAASTFNFLGGTILGDLYPYVPPDDGGEEGAAGESIAVQLINAGSASGGFDPLAGKIVATAGSVVNIYGTELSTLLVDPNYFDPETELEYSVYELVGTLADGSPLAGQFMFVQNDAATSYNLLPPPVPEPATIMLAVIGCVGFMRLSRRQSSTRLVREFN